MGQILIENIKCFWSISFYVWPLVLTCLRNCFIHLVFFHLLITVVCGVWSIFWIFSTCWRLKCLIETSKFRVNSFQFYFLEEWWLTIVCLQNVVICAHFDMWNWINTFQQFSNFPFINLQLLHSEEEKQLYKFTASVRRIMS